MCQLVILTSRCCQSPPERGTSGRCGIEISSRLQPLMVCLDRRICGSCRTRCQCGIDSLSSMHPVYLCGSAFVNSPNMSHATLASGGSPVGGRLRRWPTGETPLGQYAAFALVSRLSRSGALSTEINLRESKSDHP